MGEGIGDTSNSDTEPPAEESPPIEKPDAGDEQPEPSPHESEVDTAPGQKDDLVESPPADEGGAGAATEPDSENQKTPLNGVVSDLGGVGEEDARYKIETLEARVGSLPCTVYVRYCKRDPFSGAWKVVEEKGDPYYGLGEITDPNADPLTDVTLINIYDRGIARGERCRVLLVWRRLLRSKGTVAVFQRRPVPHGRGIGTGGIRVAKSARILSDYGNSALGLYQSDDGDIVMRIYGDGEMRISNYGDEKQAELMRAFSQIIDMENGPWPSDANKVLSEEQQKLLYDLEHGCPAQSCGACDYGSPEGRDGECQMTQKAAELIDSLVATIRKLANTGQSLTKQAKAPEHLST